MDESTTHLEIDRKDYSRTRLRQEPLSGLRRGQVRFRIERFAMTANNVTYAVIGDMLGYWGFFPTKEGWGRVPAMGWGEVVDSAHPDIAAGTRSYGWFPMSQYVDMAVSSTSDGLRDEGEHRAGHAAVYRSYTATDRDPFYQAGADAEDRHALLRGLFLTAFLADDFLGEKGYYGAARLIVLSASSKTAIGLAQRASKRGLAEVVGVTSRANLDFVRSLDWYDRVAAYDEVDSIPVDGDAVSVDMAGNSAVLERVHSHFGNALKYSMAIGMSHHEAARGAPPSIGPTPEMFFAPTQASKRLQEWGAQKYRDLMVGALREFIDTSAGWLQLERVYGAEAVRGAWNRTLAGQVPPNVGLIPSMWER
jgi:hypothetical protein